MKKLILIISCCLFISCVDFENVDVKIITQDGETIEANNADVYIIESCTIWIDDMIRIEWKKDNIFQVYRIYKNKIKFVSLTLNYKNNK